jgi:hypothetical protein
MSLLAAKHIEMPSCCLWRPDHTGSGVYAIVQRLMRRSYVKVLCFADCHLYVAADCGAEMCRHSSSQNFGQILTSLPDR